MGIDLCSKNNNFRISTHRFAELLELAHNFGWEPMGTEEPYLDDDEMKYPCEWEGGYLTSDNQKVTVDDAREIASTLKKALNCIPDKEVGDKRRLLMELTGRYIKEFKSFCESGEFKIR